MKNSRLIILIVLSLLSFNNIYAQQSEREKGIEFFNKGNFNAAVETLNKVITGNYKDISAYYYLGLALEKQNKNEQAIENFQRAISECFVLLEKTAKEKIIINQTTDSKQKLDEYISEKISQEIETALNSKKEINKLSLQKLPSVSEDKQTLILRFFAKGNNSETVENQETSFSPIKITARPAAKYTKQAQANKTVGSITFYILFLSDGEIGLIIPRNYLPDGLTESAFEAAKNLTFEPAKKNNIPVSIIKSVAYVFQ